MLLCFYKANVYLLLRIFCKKLQGILALKRIEIQNNYDDLIKDREVRNDLFEEPFLITNCFYMFYELFYQEYNLNGFCWWCVLVNEFEYIYQ